MVTKVAGQRVTVSVGHLRTLAFWLDPAVKTHTTHSKTGVFIWMSVVYPTCAHTLILHKLHKTTAQAGKADYVISALIMSIWPVLYMQTEAAVCVVVPNCHADLLCHRSKQILYNIVCVCLYVRDWLCGAVRVLYVCMCWLSEIGGLVSRETWLSWRRLTVKAKHT